MLTRRTFIQGTGALAAGASIAGIAFPKAKIKEYGIVEIQTWYVWENPNVFNSTIFSDERRDVFGFRILGKLDGDKTRLAEIRLSAVKTAIAVSGQVQEFPATWWTADGKRKDGVLTTVALNGHLNISGDRAGFSTLLISLTDVRQVL